MPQHVPQVHQEMQLQYKRHVPVLEREEAERKRRWDHFLVTKVPSAVVGAAASDALQRQAALQELSTWLHETRAAPHGVLAERCTQLQMLVQAGLPTYLRSDVWQLFVDTKSRTVPGYYRHMVQHSLGPGAIEVPEATNWSTLHSDSPTSRKKHADWASAAAPQADAVRSQLHPPACSHHQICSSRKHP